MGMLEAHASSGRPRGRGDIAKRNFHKTHMPQGKPPTLHGFEQITERH